MSDNPSIQDQVQQSVDAVMPPGQSQFQGQGPMDPNAPPYAPPSGTPGLQNPVPVPGAVARQQQAQAQQTQQTVAKHAIFGAAVKNLVHSLQGTRTAYQANPQTGQIEETTVAATPGQFFKNLLSGMLIGAVAGSERPAGVGGNNFVGGLGRGVAANIQNAQQQDQLKYSRAEQELKNQTERERLTSEETMHAAMTAHENLQTAALLHELHAADEKTVQEHNAASRAYQKSLIDSGAVPAKLTIGGEQVDSTDGNSFVAAYSKDPSLTHAPQGYQRHFISTTDLSELHYDGNHWVDDSGNPVNIGKNISIRAYDLPDSTLKTPRQYTGKEINAARRQKVVDDDKTYTMTPDAFSALYTLGTKDAAEDARTSNQRSLAEQRDRQNKQVAEITAKRNEATAKANRTYYATINNNPANEENATKERDEALKAAEDSYQSELSALRGSPKPTPQPNPPQIKVGQTVTLKNGKQVEVTKVNPNGTFEYK
jgi:hypothetical protein